MAALAARAGRGVRNPVRLLAALAFVLGDVVGRRAFTAAFRVSVAERRLGGHLVDVLLGLRFKIFAVGVVGHRTLLRYVLTLAKRTTPSCITGKPICRALTLGDELLDSRTRRRAQLQRDQAFALPRVSHDPRGTNIAICATECVALATTYENFSSSYDISPPFTSRCSRDRSSRAAK